MSTVHLLANPAAGRGHAPTELAGVVAALRRRDVDPVVLSATSRADALTCLERAVDHGASRLLVAGGDGLVHLATQVAAGSEVVVGVVPVGTGNDFARALHLTGGSVDTAVERALGEPVALDAIRTTHGWIASVGGIGFSAAVNARANRLLRLRGPARYSVATILEVPRLRPLPLRITVDDRVHHVDATMAVVANTAYFGGGMAIVPHADPADGQLDVLLVGAVGRTTLLRFFPRVYRGTHLAHPAVTVLSGRRVRVERTDDSDEHTPDPGLWGDGEHVGTLPFDLEVVPRALRLAGARPTPTEPP